MKMNVIVDGVKDWTPSEYERISRIGVSNCNITNTPTTSTTNTPITNGGTLSTTIIDGGTLSAPNTYYGYGEQIFLPNIYATQFPNPMQSSGTGEVTLLPHLPVGVFQKLHEHGFTQFSGNTLDKGMLIIFSNYLKDVVHITVKDDMYYVNIGFHDKEHFLLEEDHTCFHASYLESALHEFLLKYFPNE
jgi:hypothetical protein